MALNIQWNWAQPTEFSNLNAQENQRQAAAAGLGQLVGGVHDIMLDRELADMLDDEGNQKRLSEINARLAEIDAELAKLETTSNVIDNTIADQGAI